MSLIGSEPTVVQVPDLFREFVLRSTPERLVELQRTTISLDLKRTPDTEIVSHLVSEDWPEPFSRWYVDMLVLHGRYLQLEVPKITAAQAEEDEMIMIEQQLDLQDREAMDECLTDSDGDGMRFGFLGWLVNAGFLLARKIRGRM